MIYIDRNINIILVLNNYLNKYIFFKIILFFILIKNILLKINLIV